MERFIEPNKQEPKSGNGNSPQFPVKMPLNTTVWFFGSFTQYTTSAVPAECVHTTFTPSTSIGFDISGTLFSSSSKSFPEYAKDL